MGPNDNAHHLGHPSQCHGLFLAFRCLHWPTMALRWLVLAFVGCHWPVVACIGLLEDTHFPQFHCISLHIVGPHTPLCIPKPSYASWVAAHSHPQSPCWIYEFYLICIFLISFLLYFILSISCYIIMFILESQDVATHLNFLSKLKCEYCYVLFIYLLIIS